MEASDLVAGISKLLLFLRKDKEAMAIITEIGEVEMPGEKELREALKKLWYRIRRLETEPDLK